MEPIAPDRPAGKAEQDQLSDISSLPAMSVDPDTGTGGAANATANYGELTQANLTYLDRRNQPGVADAEVAPTATTQELATLTDRMLRPNPTVYGPSPRSIYGFPGGNKLRSILQSMCRTSISSKTTFTSKPTQVHLSLRSLMLDTKPPCNMSASNIRST